MTSIHKVKSTELPLFIDILPLAETPNWKVAGNYQTDGDRSYEAKTTEESYINEENPTTEIDSYKLSIDNEMKCVVGDPVFDYVDDIRFNLKTGEDAEQHALLVDKYSYTTSGDVTTYRAQKFNSCIEISKQSRKGGTASTIAYKINLNGNPVNGTVTFTAGVPTFVATV